MNRVPRLSPGCDVRSLPLKPTEAFLLSRIDASVNERELGLITGLAPADVAAALERLVELGAIEFGSDGAGQAPSGERRYSAPAQPASARGPAGARVPSERRPPTSPPVSPRDLAQHFGRAAADTASVSPRLYDPAELDESVEIDIDKRRRILDVFYRLDDLTYYELLGIAEQADKKQIKSAYYLLAPEFHPDKFFRKNLGSYKQKIEAVFARITLAHDVLTSKQRRAEYDEYLETTHRNRAMAALLDQVPRDIAAVTAAVEESAAQVAQMHVEHMREVKAPTMPSPAMPGRYASEPRAPETMQSRRETLARKLGKNLRAAPRPPESTPPAPPASVAPDPRQAAEALRTRYEVARAEAQKAQVNRYVEAARTALERKDYAASANAYRIAAALAPEDADLQKTCAHTAQLAAAALAEGFLKQADYEAQQGHWVEAALSYSKVCTGRPDEARPHERAAFATLKASGNVRRAVEFARRAVELAPKMAEFRITLARAYFAAGLEKSGLGELDRAAELAPNDARVAELIARAREQPKVEK